MLCVVQNVMHFEIPHKDSAPTAVAKIKQALNQSRGELQKHATGITEKWEGNTLHFGATVQGSTITGTLDIKDEVFVIDAKLPLLWRMFEGRIEKMIQEQAGKMLH